MGWPEHKAHCETLRGNTCLISTTCVQKSDRLGSPGWAGVWEGPTQKKWDSSKSQPVWLGWEDSLEEGTANHPSILAWMQFSGKFFTTEPPGKPLRPWGLENLPPASVVQGPGIWFKPVVFMEP